MPPDDNYDKIIRERPSSGWELKPKLVHLVRRISIGNLVRQLRPLRSATIAINGTQQTIPPAVPDEQQAILDALNTPDVTH